MSGFLHDLRIGLRGLLRTPGFTAAALVTLALGIGANSAIFSVVNAVLLRPLPFAEPDRLVTLWEDYSPDSRSVIAAGEVAAYRERADLFEALAAVSQVSFALRGDGEPEQLRGALASAELFPILGVEPVLGRGFVAAEDAPGEGRVVLLTHELWQRRYGGDPSVVGRTLTLDVGAGFGPPPERAGDYTVVGVLPPGFRLPFLDEGVELWAPLALSPETLADDNHYLFAVGRLRRDASLESATRELRAVSAALDRARPAHDGRRWRVDAVPLREVVVGDVRPALLVLVGAVGFVLLTACANVASLLLARGSARRRELAVRAALGAGPRRLARQLLAESLLLAVLGAAAGLALAQGGVELLKALGPEDLPRLEEVRLDGRVLLFTLAVALGTALVFGLAPALAGARPDVREALQEGGRAVHGERAGGRLRSALVVGEVALALLLLVGAGLLLQSFLRLRDVEAGFDSERALTFHLSIPRSTYPEPEQVGTFVRSLLAELEALPGVRAAATTSSLPMSGWNSATPVLEVEGVPEPADGAGRNASFRAVSPGYVRAMGMRLLRGRDLTESDLREVAATALVNRALARELWGSRDPVGLRLELSPLEDGSENWITVVGVVGDAIEFGPDVAPPPMMYVPAVRQRDVDVVLRASGDPTALAPAVRAAFHRLDPNQPLADVGTLEERLQRATASWRFNAVAVVLFSALALVLAATGIYGVVSYAVSQRTREIGLRLALGAARADVLRNVVGRGLRLTAIGLGVGLLGALALGRTLSGVLFGVTPTDAGVLAGTTAALALVALAASAVPALRAARLDPATTLRGE